MEGSSELRRTLDEPAVSIELTGKIMVVAIVVFFVVVVFVLFLHLYAKWFWYRREADAAAADVPTQRRRRSDIVSGQVESSSTSLRLGLDPAVLRFIPAVAFNPKEFKDGLECSVCLSDVSEGEKARLLPKCNHGFHVDCIDMWFKSHSTCPLCRNPVTPQSSPAAMIIPQPLPESVSGFSSEYPIYPTNVLFWGNQTQVSTLGQCLEEDNQNSTSSQVQRPSSSSSSSSSSLSPSSSTRPDGTLVIDIQRHTNEEEDPKSPMTTRLRSLRRLLSRDRRVGLCSSSAVNAEQVDRIPS